MTTTFTRRRPISTQEEETRASRKMITLATNFWLLVARDGMDLTASRNDKEEDLDSREENDDEESVPPEAVSPPWPVVATRDKSQFETSISRGGQKRAHSARNSS